MEWWRVNMHDVKYKSIFFLVLVLLVALLGCSDLKSDNTELKSTQQFETEYLSRIVLRLNESMIKEDIFYGYYNNASLWAVDHFMSSKAKGLVEFYETLKDEHDLINIPISLRAVHVTVTEFYKHRIKNWETQVLIQSDQSKYGDIISIYTERGKQEFSEDLKYIYEELENYWLDKRLV